VLLYLLVSGRFPTGGDEESPATVVAATLEAAPAPLGLGDLDLVLDRALRKDPKDRYRSAEALAEDIERLLLGAPVRARAASVVTRLKGLLGDRS
jgi:serine/threonine-protein kinase